jgi:hypothetical protein
MVDAKLGGGLQTPSELQLAALYYVTVTSGCCNVQE